MTKTKPTIQEIANALRDIAWDAEKAADMAEDIKVPVATAEPMRVAVRAMHLCDRCAGVPALSINRCPVCRCLQEMISE